MIFNIMIRIPPARLTLRPYGLLDFMDENACFDTHSCSYLWWNFFFYSLFIL